MKTKFLGCTITLAFLTQQVSSHYIWTTLITNGGAYTTTAVRRPRDNTPVKDVTSTAMACNVNPSSATETATVQAGSTIGFRLDNYLYHAGPAAIYLGKAPGAAADWDGSGQRWFKIAEWGATFSPFGFLPTGKNELTTTIPRTVPPGEYLIRIEHIGLHVIPPEWFISCAQIRISGEGSASPQMVSIPGYVVPGEPSINVSIYPPYPTTYTPPGPTVFQDGIYGNYAVEKTPATEVPAGET